VTHLESLLINAAGSLAYRPDAVPAAPAGGGGVRGWGRDGLGTGERGRGREGAEGVDVDYAPSVHHSSFV